MPKQRKRTERDCRITGTVYERSAGRHLAQSQVQVPQMNYFDAQRSKQVLNEMEMLQRISTLETGPIHAFNPQLYQQQTLFQSQCLPPSAHSSVTAPSIQASVARLTHHQGVQPTFMVQATSQHQQQQAPRAPEPSYKGMSCENFHALVRRKLEDVAQAALNRTDGEREYQQKELILKNRLRAAIEKKTQAPAGITSVGTSPTPSASIFHTPSPSPTFRSYVPEQIHAHHVIPNAHAHAQTQLQAQLAGHQQYQMMQINNNINNPKGYQLFDTPTHNYFMSSNSTPSQTPTHAFNPNQNTFQIIQAHNLPKNQIILINPTGQTNSMTHGHVTHVQPTQLPGGVPPTHHRGVFTS